MSFDCECRPLAFYGGEFVTKQPTAIAWQFLESAAPTCATIGASGRMSMVLNEERLMLDRFRSAYDAADMVTGHFIRGFDLPLVFEYLLKHLYHDVHVRIPQGWNLHAEGCVSSAQDDVRDARIGHDHGQAMRDACELVMDVVLIVLANLRDFIHDLGR